MSCKTTNEKASRMKTQHLKNFSRILTLTASVAVISYALPAKAQSYDGGEVIELDVDQLEMPEVKLNTAPELADTVNDVIDSAKAVNLPTDTTPVSVMPEVDVTAPSEVVLEEVVDNSGVEQEVRGLTDIENTDFQDVESSDNNEYFDSFKTNDDLSGNAAPRRVDPRYEPGSKYIVVEKNASAGSQQAMLTAANRALSLHRYSAALEMFQKLRKRNPKDRNILLGLGVAQQNMGFTDSALATYRSLLKIDPRNIDARVNMLGILQTQNPQRAFKELMALWESNPRDSGVAAQLGLVSAELGNTDDAVRYLGVASSIEPTNPTHVYNMAVIYDRAGARQDAVKLYEQALEIDASHTNAKSLQRETVYDRLATLRRL